MFDPQIKVYLQEIHAKMVRLEAAQANLSSKIDAIISRLSQMSGQMSQLHNQYQEPIPASRGGANQ